MTYQLRDYQQQASDAAVRFFSDTKSKRNAIIVLPTGGGEVSRYSRHRLTARRPYARVLPE